MKRIIQKTILVIAILFCGYNVHAQSCPSGTAMPLPYCYGNSLTDEVAFQICADGPTDVVSVSIDAGTFESCCDDITVYSGAIGSGTGGTVVLTASSGDLAGTVITANAAGDCLIFVINSDGSVSCASSTQTALSVSCDVPTPPATCPSGSNLPSAYCYNNNLTDEVVFEICADGPTDIVIVDITAGTFESCCDDLTVYSGASGSSTSGTVVLAASGGDLAGTSVTANAAGECLIFIINSDGSISCTSGAQTALSVSCSAPPCTNPAATITRVCNTDLTYDVEVVVTSLGSGSGVNITDGTTTYETSVGLGTYNILGLSGAQTVTVENDVNNTCNDSESFIGCPIPFFPCGCTNCPEPLPDNIIDTFSIFVADTLGGGDCSLATNPLLAISLQFDHEYLGDLNIALVSPGGSSITLIGPVGNHGTTDFSTWDVSFIDGTPSPDAGKSGTWNNADAWGTSGTFTGMYNPNSGTLASLTGTLCGEWLLIVEDAQSSDIGNFTDFNLSFGNTTDLGCSSEGALCSSMDFGATAATACSGAITLLQDNCNETTEDQQFKFYYYTGAPYGTITIPTGAENASDLNAANAGLNCVFIGRQDDICTDVMPAFTYTNNTCAVENVNVFVMIEETGLDVDADGVKDFRTDCAPVEHTIAVNPAPMTTVVTDNGSSCGTPTVELRSGDSTVCSTLTGSACAVNGDVFNWDFSSDVIITALDDATCSNAPAALSGTVNCAGCLPVFECGCTNCPQALPDNIIDTFSIFVADTLGGGDCSLATNPLLAVSLQFDHEYLGDLNITLVSPGGSSITLIGPVGNHGATDFSTWDVNFIDGTPSPDAGKSGTWDNADAWGTSGTFTGTYNPNSGTLASLTGTLCGEWLLIVEDDQASDIGNFTDFNLSFGNITDLGCSSTTPFCDADAGSWD